MSIKSTIAAAAASPFLFAGAAFAGPYVNLEATGSYPDGAYTSGGLEAVVGYEGATESGIGWYVSGGPTVTHTEAADEFGDVEFIGYVEEVFAFLCYRGIHYAKWVCIDVIMESPSWFISNPRKEDDQETD
jgi:hypothetical protein